MAIITSDTLLSAIGYAAGEIIDIQNGATVTMDATAAPFPGTIQSLTRGKFRIVNASTTTPIVLTLNANSNDFIFQQNGIFEIRGAPISLGLATGVASEAFDLSSAPLNVIPYPSLVEIETASGSGLYNLYFVVSTAGKTVNFATTEFCAVGQSGMVLFWNATTRQLTSGNGTNGSLLPVGANVRIPNIYVTSNSTVTTPANRSLINLNPSGAIDCEWVSFSDRIYASTSTFKNVRLVDCGFAGEFSFSSANVIEFTLDNVAIQPDTEQTTSAQLFRASGINGPMTLNKVRFLSAGQVTQNNPAQVNNNFGMTRFDDCTFARRDGRDNATDEAFACQNVSPGLQVNRLSVIGGAFEATNLTDITFVAFAHADSAGTAQLSTNAANAVVGVNLNGCKFVGFRNAGVAACRSEIFNFDIQSSGNEVYELNYSGGGNTAGLTAGSDTDLKVFNAVVSGLRGDQPFIQSPAAFLNNRPVIRNVKASFASGTYIGNEGVQNGELNLIPGTPNNFMFTTVIVNFAAASGYCFANLFSPGLTPTTGALVAGPFSENISATLTGSAFFNQNGAVFLIATSDAIEVETLFSCVGIISFINASPVWTYTEASTAVTNSAVAPTGVTAEFRVRTPSGTYGTYQSLTGANLSASITALSGYDSDVGLYFQLRLTATSADTTRRIDKVYFTTNVDNTYQAPDATVTLVGPNPTDVTTMYKHSDHSVVAVFTGAGTKDVSGAAAIYGQDVYYTRRTSGAIIIMSTQSTPVAITVGDNGMVDLFSGAEVQLAQSTEVSEIKSKIDLYLDAAISSRLATADATFAQVAALTESDKAFVPGVTPGSGALHFYYRGTTTDIIPPKTVSGTSQTQSAALVE